MRRGEILTRSCCQSRTVQPFYQALVLGLWGPFEHANAATVDVSPKEQVGLSREQEKGCQVVQLRNVVEVVRV